MLRTLDVGTSTRQITSMAPRFAGQRLLVALVCMLGACGGKERGKADSASSLPPVFPAGPAANKGWNPDAGPVMIVSAGGNTDTVAVILPEATDSTLGSLQGVSPLRPGITFDLFGRAGKIASTIAASPLTQTDSAEDCNSWPLARLQSPRANWQVGFVSGHVQPIALDSIEAMPAGDSSALAVSLAQTAATLPAASDPTFRGLPFRVRSAYRYRLDTLDVVIADVVRTLNEEASPRVEHLLIVGESRTGRVGIRCRLLQEPQALGIDAGHGDSDGGTHRRGKATRGRHQHRVRRGWKARSDRANCSRRMARDME